MAAVRKSGRIRTRKKSHFPNDEYQYEGAGFDLDVSQNISNLLNIHSAEGDKDKLEQSSNPFTKVPKKSCGNSNMDGGNSVKTSGDKSESAASSATGLYDSNSQFISERLAPKPRKTEFQRKTRSVTVYTCDYCGKVLPDLAAYRRHLRVHTGEKPFKCPQCEKSFSENCSLKRHMKTHEDERPFTCDVCFKTFRDATSFGRHQLTHTERPRSFQCLSCDKSFTDKSGLKRHERTHSGLRPYVCEICHKAFSEAGSFRRHQKIHFGVRNFQCNRCKRSFMEKQSLIRHQKTVCGFWEEAPYDAYSTQKTTVDSKLSAYPGGTQSHGIKSKKKITKTPPLVVNNEISNSDSRSSKSDIPAVQETSLSSSSVKSAQKSSHFSGLKLKHKSQKVSPSLGSLIRKDPNLYDSISEIVESIDSYEKMLDLCGDNGQKEIDAALTRELISLPENLMCFECGEVLVDGENFHSEGKSFHPEVNNSFRCLNCEDDKESYGDPPVLTAEDNQSEDNLSVKGEEESVGLKSESMGYITAESGDIEPAVHFDVGDCVESKVKAETHQSYSSNGTPSSQDIEQFNFMHYDEKHVTEDGSIPQRQSMPHLHAADTSQMSEILQNSLDSSKSFEYEVDDPNIPSIFPCHLCTKVFATSSFLEQHLALHKKSPFKCMVCGKLFAGNPALKRHMRVHTGEKPYVCPFCNKTFRDPSNFGKHKKFCYVNGFAPSPVGSTSSINSATSAISVNEEAPNNFDRSIEDEHQRISDDEISSSHPPVHFDDQDVEHGGEESNINSPQPIMVMPASIDDFDEHSHDGIGNQNMDEAGREKQMINYIPCTICQKLCESEQHLEMHMNFHNGNPDVTCIECGKSFADSNGMKRHMRIHAESRPYSCEYCSKGYCDNWSLRKHRSRGCLNSDLKVPVDFLYPCTKCSRVFSGNDLLEEHMHCHKGTLNKFECDICLKKFTEAFNLRRHRRLHMSICPGCGGEFKNMEEMNEHQKDCSACVTQKKQKPAVSEEPNTAGSDFPCPDCGRTYSTLAYLKRHRKFHTDLKIYSCDVCNKKFGQAFRLRRHLQVHTQAKPFICQNCGKGFADEAFLKRHTINNSCTLSQNMQVSQGAVSYPCQYCDKIFSKNYMLVRHMNVHSQERPFTCDVCGRAYKDTSSLKRHKLTHQGVKEFICTVCGKDFFYADSLRRHVTGSCSKAAKKGRRRNKSSRGRRLNTVKSENQDSINNNEIHITGNNGHVNSAGIDNDPVKTGQRRERKLNTPPYKCKTLNYYSKMLTATLARFKRNKIGPWLCRNKSHCWRCDSKMPSKDHLISHVTISHHKNKFACRQCFARFSCKLYWRAHMNSSYSHTVKRSRRKTRSEGASQYQNIRDLSESQEGNGRRPKRSIPRARWSWLTQIYD